MIDFVRMGMNIVIPDDAFRLDVWRECRIPAGTLIRYHRFRGVWVRYYPELYRMTITGKPMILLEDSEVLNVDDVYGLDILQFIDDLNAYLNHLFYEPYLDVRKFSTKRIDYCFNISTLYVREYLDFLTQAFRMTNNGQRVNYTMEKGLNGSVYIKTRSDYENNERRNYVLNYYNKIDRLNYLRSRGHRVAKHDFEYARGVLRLEVQCGFLFIKQLCKYFQIEPLFGNLLNFDIAYFAHKTVYRRIFHCDDTHDYFTYPTAKKRIPNRQPSIQALLTASQGHKITDAPFAYGRKLVQSVGVFPFCFLPRDGTIDMLENPLKLIRRKLAEIGFKI